VNTHNCSFCGATSTETNKLIVGGGVGDDLKDIDTCICGKCVGMLMLLIATADRTLFEGMVEEARRGPPAWSRSCSDRESPKPKGPKGQMRKAKKKPSPAKRKAKKTR